MDKNHIWIGSQDLEMTEEFVQQSQQEFQTNPGTEIAEGALELEGGRRDFLKMLGFGLGAATIAAGCDTPVKRAIPYVVKPEEIIPGVATYYASCYSQGGNAEAVVVKTREGRPIHIEGNAMANGTTGLSPRAQASVLSLYNTNRIQAPLKSVGDGYEALNWAGFDNEVLSILKGSRNIRVVTNSIASPSARKTLAAFKAKYPNTEIFTYDPVSYGGMLEANTNSFGSAIIPRYHFDKADMIVSFDADFLGSWLGGGFATDYAKGRKVDPAHPKMSKHVQVEAHMSLTGSNADNRVLVRPSEQGAAIAYLANEIVGGISGPKLNQKAQKALKKVASDLKSAGSKALVVSGSNNTYEQLLVNEINNALGAYGNTISLSGVCTSFSGDERNIDTLISELPGNGIDTVIFYDCNPAYDFAGGNKLADAVSKAKNRIALAYTPNETTALCNYIAPINHYLESWGDAEKYEGETMIVQPTIGRLFNTRQLEESIMVWSGAAAPGSVDFMHDKLQGQLKDGAFASQDKFYSFASYWNAAVHDGMLKGGSSSYSFSGSSLAGIGDKVSKPSNAELEIKFFETIHMGNGNASENPWLMEMPDPVARTSWGNYLAVPVNFDGVRTMVGLNGLEDGDMVEITIGDQSFTVPVIQQFGQMPGTVALALGYGRKNASPLGKGIGVNVNTCLTTDKGRTQYYNTKVSLGRKLRKEEHFSCVQYHHTFGVKGTDAATGETINADEAATVFVTYGAVQQGYQGSLTERSIVYNSHINDLDASIADLEKRRANAQYLNDKTLYPYDEYVADKYSQGHHWGMHVDLNACIGCGACTVACMSENNVPIVGKREVSRHHEMTWLRIDRYYYGDVENPNTVYQPMMCQHCDNAPCENVCPVNATNHSSEGLNQMTYNRCVGTRYCANNCPYKVRRFNWLDYTTADIFPANQIDVVEGLDKPFYADNLTRMVLNPDVTVRARGVIEKCSFCVQRLQAGKLEAKIEGRRLKDSDVTTACESACPTGAITFGDFNNKGGDLDKKLQSPLNYIALEEVNVKSSVTYTMKVNNRDETLDA